MTIASLTKASVEVTVNGRPIRFSPLTFKDLGDFELWVQYRPYKEMRAIGADAEAIRETLKECGKTKPTGEDTSSAMSTITGIAELLYLSARHEQPDIARDAFDDLPVADLQELMQVVNAITGGDDHRPPKGRKATHAKN